MKRLLSFTLALCMVITSAVFTTAHAAKVGNTSISAAGACVMDFETGDILYSYYGDTPRVPASMTKIMNLYCVYEALANGEITLNTTVPISKSVYNKSRNGLYQSVLPLHYNTTYTVDEMINVVIVHSASGAAVALAELVGGGSEAAFVSRMNNKAKEMGINAYYYDSCGIANNQVSPIAMATLARNIIKDYPDILTRSAKKSVYFHGGNETNPIPSPMKVELYRHFIDIGAEAVIAMHTHCPQGYEMYNGKPIVYSMGNFFFPANRSQLKSWNYGYMAMVDFTKDGTSLEIFPYKFDYEGHYILEGEEKEHFLKYIEVLNKTFEDEEELQKWFDAWCTTQIHYANALTTYKEEILTSNIQSENTRAKNVFNCEAHNEVVRNILNMAYECRFEEAKERVPLIKKLQEVELM